MSPKSGVSQMTIQRAAGTVAVVAIVIAGLSGVLCFRTVGGQGHAVEASFAADSETRDTKEQPLSLDDLVSGKLKIIDLGWPLNDKGPYWPAENYEPFRLKTIATIEKEGVLSKSFCSPEHLGTHLDAPNHFENNQPAVDQIDPADLFAQGIVVDISMQADADPDYTLSRRDLDDWEQRQGRIPEGAVVLLHTGWGRFWENPARYRNQATDGKMHFPGGSAEAARWLVSERHIKGMGIDTLSIDHGISKDFVVHHVLNGAGRYAVENLARLERLPARGFYLFVAPIKIETGSGGPARVFAVSPK